MKKTIISLIAFAVCGPTAIQNRCVAQTLAPDTWQNYYPFLSNEQAVQGHYNMAGQSAERYAGLRPPLAWQKDASDAEQLKYNSAIAHLAMDVPGAAQMAAAARNDMVNPAHAERVSFALGQYYFKRDKFAAAIRNYEDAGIANLDNQEVGDQKFELAYCYFNNRQFDKARPLFLAMKDVKENKYYIPGNYYYGLLCYNENRYNEALACFEKVKEEKEYSTIVPYYIAEIYYFKGDRQKALDLAKELIGSKDKSYYHNELHLLAAQCLFENKLYADALPYFEYYYEHVKKIRKEDLYEIAYCHYRLNQWKKAIDKFSMLSDARDSLGQTSMYLLGDCFLKTNDRASARNAFGMCADMSFNTGQQEAAMMLYARLSYETGNKDEALRQLNSLLRIYPRTQYRDEAKTLISDLLVKTNKYEEAVKSLAEVKTKDREFQGVYQRACYGYGVQLFRNGEMKQAHEYFERSLEYPVNAEYERASYFWMGEIAYDRKKYTDAINYSQNFISRNGDLTVVERISPQASLQHAYITMGYAAMETGNYVAAQDFFSQAQQAKGRDRRSTAKAMLLEADAVFLQKNYTKALALYEKVIEAKGADADYAKYQKAVLLGLQNKNDEKIELLQSITEPGTNSGYSANARYEIALTYLEMDRYPQALKVLRQIMDSATDGSILPKVLMKIGFIHQQMNENGKAIDAYRKIVVKYPAAEERLAALEALKGLYIQTNQPGQYSRVLRDANLTSADSSSMDSTYYAAAEAQFANNNWESARQAFTDYIENYPHGIFSVKAHYYRGESLYRMKRYAEAKNDYDVVLEAPWNDFSESSAGRGALIDMDAKEYADAFRLYSLLRANTEGLIVSDGLYRGLMKSAFLSGRYDAARSYADTLLTIPGIPADATTEARFYKARVLQLQNSNDEAIAAYKELTGDKAGEIAAESRYRIAEILLKQDRLKEAETAANETIERAAGYDAWVGKAYILLSDILLKQKDYFNAKALLQSIVKNTKNAELKLEAGKKLEEVKAAEKEKSKLSEE